MNRRHLWRYIWTSTVTRFLEWSWSRHTVSFGTHPAGQNAPIEGTCVVMEHESEHVWECQNVSVNSALKKQEEEPILQQWWQLLETSVPVDKLPKTRTTKLLQGWVSTLAFEMCDKAFLYDVTAITCLSCVRNIQTSIMRSTAMVLEYHKHSVRSVRWCVLWHYVHQHYNTV